MFVKTFGIVTRKKKKKTNQHKQTNKHPRIHLSDIFLPKTEVMKIYCQWPQKSVETTEIKYKVELQEELLIPHVLQTRQVHH